MSANQFKINLCQHLKTAAINRPDSLAVALQLSKANKDAFKEMTFAELDLQSDQIAFSLCQGGIKRGMKAVLMVKPGLEFFALTFGLFKAGIIPVMLDPGMGLSKLKTCINNVAADVFIGIPQAHFARRLLGWGRNSIKHLITVNGSGLWGGSSLDAMLAELNDDCQFDMALLNSDELCAILYTSGSTGSPKGVYYSHSMFEAQIQALKKDYGIAAGEVDLSTFPLFALFGPALGMASIVPDMDASKPIKADPARLLAAVEHYSCSNMFINPALLAKFVTYSADKTLIPLIRQQLSSVKRVISAGAPANVNHIDAFSRLLPDGAQVLNSYGATEALPISMIASDELLLTREVTDNGGGICVGQALSGVEIRIIEIDERVRADIGDTENLSQSTIGEVMVRGAVVSPEYCDNPLATEKAKVLDGNRFWHRMGDLGYLDKQGRLWMCGRKGHRVCCDEKDYYSIPCERIFNTHAAVKRSALVGINLNNVPQPLICVELESGVSVNKAQLFNELKALAEQSPHTLGIRRFLLHPNFPVDVRHNAKIFREKLAFWAQKKWRGV